MVVKNHSEYYAVTTRRMLREAKTIGDAPFKLFQYYLTWLTAPKGIRPPLEMVAEDLGLTKPSICNLRSVLIKHGWIKYKGGQVFITKEFIENHSSDVNHSSEMNNNSSDVNPDSSEMNNYSSEMNPLYKDKDSKRTHTEEKPSVRVNPKRRTEISASEMFGETDEYESAALATLTEKRMDSPASMPEWYQAIAYAQKLDKDPETFRLVIESIKKWARYRVTPEMVMDHFGKFLEEREKSKTDGKPQMSEYVWETETFTYEATTQDAINFFGQDFYNEQTNESKEKLNNAGR